jgi:hypothetical protein
MSPQPAFVIAVSGPSGAGKTTIVTAVAARLGDAATLFYDEYFHLAPRPDIQRWVEEGCSPDLWVSLPQLVADVQALREGQVIEAPRGRRVMPAPYLVLEEPWGRDRTELRPWIDFVAHIDIPLDISLCRKLLREYAVPSPLGDPLAFVQDYLDFRLGEVYRRQQQVAERADLVVDGLRPIDQIAAEIVAAIRRADAAQ